MPDNTHDLQFTILLQRISNPVNVPSLLLSQMTTAHRWHLTLKRLSWRTRLMAASSPLGEILVWNTTPKDPFPTILHCVYCMSRVSPVNPSWTFSRITSAKGRRVRKQKSVSPWRWTAKEGDRAGAGGERGGSIETNGSLTPHAQTREHPWSA